MIRRIFFNCAASNEKEREREIIIAGLVLDLKELPAIASITIHVNELNAKLESEFFSFAE